MKTNATKRVLAMLLALAMLLPTLADVAAFSVSAASTTYGEANVYDIYDLTGSKTNTVTGTGDGNWDGAVLGDVNDKENFAFKTKLTAENLPNAGDKQQIRLHLAAKDDLTQAEIWDPPGYAVYIDYNNGAPWIAIKRNQQDLVTGGVSNVTDTWELEIGIVDILDGDTRVGKHLYVKQDGEIVCKYDDVDDYLTGDALGTRIVDFHYGAAIQMDTTYETTYGTPTVYDIFDLTGSKTNTIKGTDETWDGQIHANISTEHKENFAFKTKLTMQTQNVRLSLTAQDGDSHYDPVGYAVYLYGADNKVEIRRSNSALESATVESLAGTYTFEVGIVDILFGGERTGKYLYVKINDTVVCEYKDTTGYLTGDTLGTKIIDFHYGAAIQMDTTYEIAYVGANVHDLWHLTGGFEGGIFETSVNAWASTKLGSIAEANKEQAAIRLPMSITDERHRYRFSVGAAEGVDCTDLKGYGLEIAVRFDPGSGTEYNYVAFNREGADATLATFNDVTALIGDHTLEFGYRTVTVNGNPIGKQVYLSVDGTDLYTYEDLDGYLTGEALGTMVAMHHIDDAAVTLSSVYDSDSVAQDTAPQTYDIYDITGSETNTVNGTGAEDWDGVILGQVGEAYKESMVFKTMLTMGEQEVRLSLNALDDLTMAEVQDPLGYAVYINHNSGAPYISIRRNNTELVAGSPAFVSGTWKLEIGVVNILAQVDGTNTIIGKHLYVKQNDAVVCEYDDFFCYLTGDALGTNIIDFHYGAAITMATTYEDSYGTPTVYDIFDLTGSKTNTVTGTGDGNWDGAVLGDVNDKENFAFKTKLTAENLPNAGDNQQIRLHLAAKDDLTQAEIWDPPGYAVYIDYNNGAPYIAIMRGKTYLTQGSASNVTDTWELEIGIVDILTGGERTGKHLYVKQDGEIVCKYDDVDDYLTGDTLGTNIIDFHYGAAIQMDTTYESSYGTAKVYDIYDLTGSMTNTFNGTGNGNWSASVMGNIDTADKESVSLKANVNISDEAKYRFSLGALESDGCVDPAGYGMELIIGASGSVEFTRGSSRANLKTWTGDTTNLKGEYLLEFGYRDITFNGNVVGKQVFLMKDGEVLYSYEDTEGYLTGNTLGTKAAVFHYGTAIQMDTTYESTYGEATVYDIYDLTGATAKQITQWECTQIGSFAAENKEQAALRWKMSITNAKHRYRFAVGNTTDGNVWDPLGYSMEIAVQLDGANHVKFLRNASQIAYFDDVSSLIGDHVYEFGYRNITVGDTVTGKQVYLKVDGVILYSFDDGSGYLTGDTLGNTVTLNHIDDSAVTLYTTYETSYSTPTVYDVWDLTGSKTNTYNGTGNDNWSASVMGNIDTADKESVSLKAKVTITEEQVYRFSLGALDSDECIDPAGYAFALTVSESGSLSFMRGSSHTTLTTFSADTTGFIGTYVLEFGYQDIIFNGETIGKRLFLAKDGEVLYTYDDADGYLTGDALGTKVAVFHYGTSIQMDTTLPTFVNGYNLTLGGSTVMNFWLDPVEINDSAATIQIAVNGTVKATYTLSELPLSTDGYRKVSVPLAAAQLNDPVALTVIPTDGESATRTYSVVDYANYIYKGDYTDAQKAVVVALLHYGAAAQDHFNYNADDLANAGYEDGEPNTITSITSAGTSGSVDGVTLYGSTLLFEESITLRHYLNITGDVSSYTFTINGETVTPVKTSKYAAANYYVELQDILPNKLDELYDLCVSDGEDTLISQYSPTSYLLRMSTKGSETQQALVQQLYDYHVAVKALASTKVVDTPVVLDLYELSGKESITMPASTVQPIGLLVGTDDSIVKKELTNNVAIRFKYTGGEGMRLHIGANTQDLDSTSGALFVSVPDNNSFGIYKLDQSGWVTTDTYTNGAFSWQTCLARNATSYIEIGCVKRYTDGVYTHDRYYIKAADSLETLDTVDFDTSNLCIYYDTTMRDNNGSKVIARSRMDGGGDVLETTWTADEITAYEARLSSAAQSATSDSYDALEEKYSDTAVSSENTAASLAAATKPSTTTATNGDELILWAESGVSKIVQDDDGKAASLASSKNTLSIQMAKNEYEGAQLMLFGKRNVASYQVFVTDLTSGSNTITADNIHLYQLKYLTVDDKNSGSSYDTPDAYSGEKLPDAMLPFAKAVEYGENSIIAGNNQAIYLDVATKSTDAAGTYTGTVVVTTESNVYTLPISVVVRDVVMPDTSALGTYAPYLGRDSFTSGELDGSDEMASLYTQIMQDFNMSSVIPASDDVLDIEKFLVNVRKNYDSVTNYILPVDNNDSYYTVDGTTTAVYCNYALLKEYVVELAKMSVADGENYLDKAFFYPSDHADESKTEEEFNIAKATYTAYCQMLDDADAELTAIYSGTTKYASSDIQSSVKNLRFLLTVPGDDDNGKSLDVGALLTDFLGSADRKNVILCTTNEVLVRETYGDAVASAMTGAYAAELWTYLCLKPYYPYSNYAFDTPVVGLRTLGWTCYQENVDTLMTYKSVNYLYGTDGLSLDRWTTSSAGTSTPTPGDGNIFYPGAKYGIDGPCPSLRAVAWRDGVDDYNLMSVVADNGGTSNLTSLYGLITETYTDSIKASSETGSWWGSLISKNVDATVPIDDDAKFAIVRNALLQMAASDASGYATILSNAQTAVNAVVTATGSTSTLEDAGSETTETISGNVYNSTDGYYQLADFESYAETIQNKFSGNAQLGLSGNAENGSYSLKVAVQPGQKGETVWIPTTSKYFSATTNFSGATKITFKVYNAQSTSRTVRFYLNTYDRSGDVYNTGTYYKDSDDIWHDDHPSNVSLRYTLAPGWNTITVNASDISDWSCVGAFVIAFDSGVGYDAKQVFYLDDVRVYMDKVAD